MNRDKKTANMETVYTNQGKECVCSWGLIYYFYLTKRVENGEQLCMRDIYTWCYTQGIDVIPKFQYLKRLPIAANIWNFYSYLRAKYEYIHKISKGK